MYINRTRLYISPVLNTMSATFVKEFSKVSKSLEGFYIVDIDYYKAKKWDSTQPVLFCRFKKDIKWFLKFVRTHTGYIDDYILSDSEICVVMKIPAKFQGIISHFLKGEYSKMYSPKDLKEVGITEVLKGSINTTYCVLTKDARALPYYQSAVKIVYNITNDSMISNFPIEYDIPPRGDMDALNWKKDIDLVKRLGLTNFKYD